MKQRVVQVARYYSFFLSVRINNYYEMITCSLVMINAGFPSLIKLTSSARVFAYASVDTPARIPSTESNHVIAIPSHAGFRSRL